MRQLSETLKPYVTFELKNKVCRAGEMVQWLRVLATLLEDLGFVLSTQMAVHNHL